MDVAECEVDEVKPSEASKTSDNLVSIYEWMSLRFAK
jgi:hypothetical protein